MQVRKGQLGIGAIRMNVKINNVAKVLRADISMKGLTVIAGLNNTGKSTILKSIYMGLNSFRVTPAMINTERQKSVLTVMRRMAGHFDNEGYGDLPQVLLDDISSLINENMDDFIHDPDDYGLFKKLFMEAIGVYGDLVNESEFENLCADTFLEPIYEQVRDVFVKDSEVYIQYLSEMYLRNVFSSQFNNVLNSLEGCIEIQADNKENFIRIEKNKIQEMSFNMLKGPKAVYIPTYNILDNIGKKRFRVSYPEKDVRDYVQAMDRHNESYEDYMEIEDNISTIKEILEEVVHGSLERTPSGEIRYMDRKMKTAFSMDNVASGMKTFLLIQSLVESGKIRRNSVLLIDEPETNLHPEWHLIFAEVLVLMYKYMGVISVVNSHSPYFIRALEVQMADQAIGADAAYYLMEEEAENSYTAVNVTGATNRIYETLYKPLEYL